MIEETIMNKEISDNTIHRNNLRNTFFKKKIVPSEREFPIYYIHKMRTRCYEKIGNKNENQNSTEQL